MESWTLPWATIGKVALTFGNVGLVCALLVIYARQRRQWQRAWAQLDRLAAIVRRHGAGVREPDGETASNIIKLADRRP